MTPPPTGADGRIFALATDTHRPGDIDGRLAGIASLRGLVAASDETLRAYFFAGTVRDWQVIVPDLGTVEGPFQIATLEYGGQHDGEVTFDLSLESAGALSFAAAS